MESTKYIINVRSRRVMHKLHKPMPPLTHPSDHSFTHPRGSKLYDYEAYEVRKQREFYDVFYFS
jgi:hypothetical protein